MVVPEGFLLDGVWVGGAGFRVDEGIECSLLVLSDVAISQLSVGNEAAASAEMAVHLLVCHAFVEHRFVRGGAPPYGPLVLVELVAGKGVVSLGSDRTEPRTLMRKVTLRAQMLCRIAKTQTD